MGVLPFIPGTGMKCFILGHTKDVAQKTTKWSLLWTLGQTNRWNMPNLCNSELLFWTAICPVVVKNSFWMFLDSFGSGLRCLVGFLPRYHLPCICNSLELEPVILHGICYLLAWSLCILHGICYILVLQTFMWVSSIRPFYLGFHWGCHFGIHEGFL